MAVQETKNTLLQWHPAFYAGIQIELAEEAGGLTVSLGARILRAETAAITAVGMCMLHAEMNF